MDRPRRASRDPRHARPTRATVVAGALLLLLLAGCTGGGTTAPEPTAPPAPSAPATPEPAPAPEPEPLTLPVHFVRSGPVSFFVEPVEVDATAVLGERDPSSLSSEELVAVLVELLLTSAPTDPDLATSVPPGVRLLDVTVTDGVATVDVDAAIDVGASSSQETTFAEQLAHTVTRAPDVTAVRLFVDGAPIVELWGHLDWSDPIVPDQFALSPITIVTPAHGAVVPAGEVTISGLATVFEATLLVRVYDAAGALVLDTFTTASEGGPGRGDWSLPFAFTPGAWVIEAEAPDMSDGEGPPPFITRRTVTVIG